MSEPALTLAPDSGPLPVFESGWVSGNGSREPYLSYAGVDASVNWSAELESLHEESTRDHFMDRWTRRAILERIGRLSDASTVLDLGCSSGYLLEDLRRSHSGATLYGVDLVGAGLEKAHANVPDARLLRADVCDLPFADQTIDAICSANLLEHVPDDRKALREASRVLRPGARAAIVVPAGPGTYDYYDRFLGHERRYGRQELAEKAVSTGFEVLEDAYLGSLIYPAFWLVKQRNRRRFGHLDGAQLEHRVAADIAATQDSRLGRLTCEIERLLLHRGIRLPFGIRNLVSLRRC